MDNKEEDNTEDGSSGEGNTEDNNTGEDSTGEDSTGEDNTYEVGYKKPPLHTQFQSGQSGNPSGRPKGSRNKRPFAPGSFSIFEFQKLFVDLGHEEIDILKNGENQSIPKIEAMILQLYNKALKGHLGSANLLLNYTKNSMQSLHAASQDLYRLTLDMREKERKQIFATPPTPNTYGVVLEKKHFIYSVRFAHREVFGEDSMPILFDFEPECESDWNIFNYEMKKEYKLKGHREYFYEGPEMSSMLFI